MTTADAILAKLKASGVRRIYGLPGDSLNGLTDAMRRDGRLDWVHVRRAKALGIPLVINPDAHDTGELEFYRYGVDVARRGWLEAKDVFNTRTLGQVEKALLGSR